MKYAKTYIDEYFDTITEFNSKVELFSIAYARFEKEKDSSLNWIVELKEIINWQSISERSGVWTYYEVLDDYSAQILINSLKDKNEIEILPIYSKGINNYDDEFLMEEIDSWILNNEGNIYQYIEEVLIKNKDWFYRN